MKTYFTVSGTSRNSCCGVKWALAANVSEKSIVEAAEEECRREGTTLEEVAGIRWLPLDESEGTLVPERDYRPGEELHAAIAKLSDDGRTYLVFSEREVEEFLAKADEIGLGDEARRLRRSA